MAGTVLLRTISAGPITSLTITGLAITSLTITGLAIIGLAIIGLAIIGLALAPLPIALGTLTALLPIGSLRGRTIPGFTLLTTVGPSLGLAVVTLLAGADLLAARLVCLRPLTSGSVIAAWTALGVLLARAPSVRST